MEAYFVESTGDIAAETTVNEYERRIWDSEQQPRRRRRSQSYKGFLVRSGCVEANSRTCALPPEPASTVVPPEQLRFLVVVNHEVHIAVSVDIVDVQPPD